MSNDAVILSDILGTTEKHAVVVCFKVGYYPSVYLEELSRDSRLRAEIGTHSVPNKKQES
jgi:hypothetical protein